MGLLSFFSKKNPERDNARRERMKAFMASDASKGLYEGLLRYMNVTREGLARDERQKERFHAAWHRLVSIGISVDEFDDAMKVHAANELEIFFVETCQNPEFKEVFEEEVRKYFGFPQPV